MTRVKALIFPFMLFCLILSGCSSPASAPMAAAPPPSEEEGPVIAGAPAPEGAPAFPTSPPPEEQGSTNSLLPEDFASDRVASTRELEQADFEKLLGENSGYGDLMAYAKELGYGGFLAAEQNVYKNGATYTMASYMSEASDVVFVTRMTADKGNSYSLVRFEDVTASGETLTSGKVEVFDREGGMTMDLASLQAESYGGHYSCNNWHCYGACASVFWGDPIMDFVCGGLLTACISEPTKTTCLGLLACAGGTLAFCMQCDFDPCDYCSSDSCGQTDTWYPLTCDIFNIGYYETRYRCEDPDSSDSPVHRLRCFQGRHRLPGILRESFLHQRFRHAVQRHPHHHQHAVAYLYLPAHHHADGDPHAHADLRAYVDAAAHTHPDRHMDALSHKDADQYAHPD